MTCLTHPVFDRARSLERFEGDEELLRELISLFLEDCPRMLGDLDEAIRTDDVAEAGHAAHALKGSMSNFDAFEAVEVASRLEAAGRVGSLATAREIYPDLLAAVNRFRDALVEAGRD